MRTARWRLASLWLSQTARFLADNCLRVFVALQVGRTARASQAAAWHLATGVFLLPAVLLTPVSGGLCNSVPRRVLLAGSAAACLAATILLGLIGEGALLWWALVAVASAVYSPARYALLPAAAEDAQLPLTRVNGWIEMGTSAAVVGGWVLGAVLSDWLWLGWEAPLAAAAGLNLLGLLTALPVRFPSDVLRRESAGGAIRGFFRDAGRILEEPEAAAALLGLGLLQAVLGATVGAVLAALQGGADFSLAGLLDVGLWVGAGLALGSLLAGVQRHLRRALGLVPVGASGLFLGLLLAAAWGAPGPVLCLLLGLAAGLISVPLAAYYQAVVPADARGNAMAIRVTVEYLGVTGFASLLAALALEGVLSGGGQLWLVAGLAGLTAVLAWWLLTRHFLELLLEWVVWPMYRIRGHGPGFAHFPARGPVLVVANHTAWLDPVWLGKVVPRRIIPMMTSLFYDLPPLRWLMKYVGAIRVQASTFRREAPELAQAVGVLDGGGCVLIFPEGSCRRQEERPIRPFGQGVWHILHQRPTTPVVVCWIEGGWGSFCSYYQGPPTKNKALDFRRLIDIAAVAPQVLKPDMLASQKETRAYLQRCCLEARAYLGLPAFAGSEEGAEE